LSILKIEMWRGTDLPCHGYLVVKCHTSSVNIWVCSKHGCSGNKCARHKVPGDCCEIGPSSID